ncbi:MAG: hypothetical protein A0129_12190 [Limnobacter sp. CACIAM 66H1]|uniref:phage head spike fiber domain-containing protein n=1 Tax=Limnobacter sp. CACIAM 66H1 TaxID=1813033 RepID=UPI0007A7D1CE|nr:hypothetical protein [Limnobacter sp. CACIAM 66H1]KYP10550.1 MAG: hypothetical protein A0129_12190 [Limnobacter sp. CACIAM 66H1]
MTVPQITALPDPPSRQDPTNFAVKGDAFLGALPDFATEANALATQVNERVDAAFAAGLESAATNAATTVTKAAEARASELAAAGFANEAMLLSLGVETLRPSIKPSLLLDFARAQVVPPSVTFTRASTATRVGPSGLIETVGINVPRLDYDPITRACLGLLVEEQRTNLLLNSVFAGAVSGTPGTAPTSWSFITANGTTTFLSSQSRFTGGNKLRFSATANRHYLGRSVAVTAGQSSCFSSEFEVVSGTIGLNSLFSGVAQSGAVFTSKYYLDGIEVLDNTKPTVGKHKIHVVHTVTTGGEIQNRVGIGTINNATADVIFDIPQFEVGAFPTSYIPTTTASVTRAADVASVNTLSPWYRADEGTFFVEASSVVTGVVYAYQLDDGTLQNRIFSLVDNAHQFSVRIADTVQAQLDAGSVLINSPNKIAGSYKANDFALSLNGSAPVFDIDGSVPNASILRIGSTINSGYLNGHIRQIKYFPQRLTNAQLQALTSL